MLRYLIDIFKISCSTRDGVVVLIKLYFIMEDSIDVQFVRGAIAIFHNCEIFISV